MLRILTPIIISLLGFNAIAQNSIIERVGNYLDSKNIFTDEIIYVSIKKQTLYHIQHKRIIREYTISTSSYGIGSRNGSNKNVRSKKFNKN